MVLALSTRTLSKPQAGRLRYDELWSAGHFAVKAGAGAMRPWPVGAAWPWRACGEKACAPIAVRRVRWHIPARVMRCISQ